MAENGADAAAMTEAAVRTGLALAIGHTFRHSGPIRFLTDHQNEFGALRAIEVPPASTGTALKRYGGRVERQSRA